MWSHDPYCNNENVTMKIVDTFVSYKLLKITDWCVHAQTINIHAHNFYYLPSCCNDCVLCPTVHANLVVVVFRRI